MIKNIEKATTKQLKSELMLHTERAKVLATELVRRETEQEPATT